MKIKKILVYTLIAALLAWMAPSISQVKAANLYDVGVNLNNQFTTYLTATADVGATTLPVADTSGITAGDKLYINDASTPEVVTVASVDATAKTITISVGLTSLQGAFASLITVFDAASSNNLTLAFSFKNETYIGLLKTVRFDFTYEPEETGTQNNFVADGGDMTTSAVHSVSGLPTNGTPALTESSDVLSYAYNSAQVLAADQSITMNIDNFNRLPSGATTNEYPVKISLIDSVNNTIDIGMIWYSIEEGVYVEASVDTNLTFTIGTSPTAPTNGSIAKDFIKYAELYDGTAKTGTMDYTVSQNAADGYTVNTAGDAALTSSAGEDTIAACAGSNTTPAAWDTVSSSDTSAYGYHSSDELLATGTTDRFSADDTFAAYSGTWSEVAYSAGATAGTSNDAGGSHSIAVKAEVDAMHPSGTYTGKFDLEAVPVY